MLKITYTVEQGNFKEDVTVYKNLLDILPPDDSNHPFFKEEKRMSFILNFHLILSSST